MRRFIATTLVAWAATAVQAEGLSIPNHNVDDFQSELRDNENGTASALRAQAVRDTAGKIYNEPRAWVIDGKPYPFCNGPVVRPGSLAASIVAKESQLLKSYSDTHAASYIQTAASITYKSVDDYLSFYDKIQTTLPRPMGSDISDETYGEQRLTILGFTLKTTSADSYAAILEDVPDEQAASVCGDFSTVASLGQSERLLVSDFGDFAQWTDEKQKATKYAPGTIGFFCFNEEKSQLLPLAIHIVDTNITYTSADRLEEWTLAKMALTSVELNFQQIWHFAETHATTSPIRVELMRNTAPTHPINALLQHHFQVDSALELAASIQLFNKSTAVDQTLAWGATGSMRYLAHLFDKRMSMKNTFNADIKRLGNSLPRIHKYAQYGAMHHEAIETFVREYLGAYYRDDFAVRGDRELNAWARACAQIPHLADFPEKFENLEKLVQLVTHLVFTVTVKHHAMNGAVSWHMVSMPYSTPALWKPLPRSKLTKEDKLDLVEYTIPPTQIRGFIMLVSLFRRDLPHDRSLLEAYNVAPFKDEANLNNVIDRHMRNLQSIENRISGQENGQQWPYVVLKPSMLPYYSWI
ncbi:TPA: hypothetical protein N0F65_004741 [Lagenidium giganteum]|uniref:Lipoxygenase domain-containing protein n=1 Tax=Lagenidium giganteum TaxID=4803 RepID=A0AAV2YKP8_9STRA|nr:TPA: hypothetical protein N0F65_004741 [Lagenidium giganteum]